jgi:hypothetical protein
MKLADAAREALKYECPVCHEPPGNYCDFEDGSVMRHLQAEGMPGTHMQRLKLVPEYRK